MLLGNYSALSKHPGRDIGGGSIGLGMNRKDYNKTSMARGIFNYTSWQKKSGIPDGYRPPYCWVIPQYDGALAARNNLVGLGSVSASVAGGLNAAAALTGSGTISAATLQLIVSLVASLTGSGTVSASDLRAYLNAVASLSGSGSLAASSSAIAWLYAATDGVGSFSSAVASALGELSATILSYGELTPEGLRDAVWNAIAANFDVPGSMGEKMNDAGSASNPWTEVIESGFTAAQILRLIASVIQGDATGLENGAPTFKGLDGVTDRVTGTYVTGTRTINVRDPD